MIIERALTGRQRTVKQGTIAQLSHNFSLHIRAIRFNSINSVLRYQTELVNVLPHYLQWCKEHDIAIDLAKLVKHITIYNQVIHECFTAFKYNLKSLVLMVPLDKIGVRDLIGSIETAKKVELVDPEPMLCTFSQAALKSFVVLKLHLHASTTSSIMYLVKYLDTYSDITTLKLFSEYEIDEETTDLIYYQSTSALKELMIKIQRKQDIVIDPILHSSHKSLRKLCLTNVQNTQNLPFWIKLKEFKSLSILRISFTHCYDDSDEFIEMNLVLEGISDLINLIKVTFKSVHIGEEDISLLKVLLLKTFNNNRHVNLTMRYDFDHEGAYSDDDPDDDPDDDSNYTQDYVKRMADEVLESFKVYGSDNNDNNNNIPVYHLMSMALNHDKYDHYSEDQSYGPDFESDEDFDSDCGSRNNFWNCSY